MNLEDIYTCISILIASIFIYFVIIAYSVFSSIWFVKLIACLAKCFSKNKDSIRQLHSFFDNKFFISISISIFIIFSLLIFAKGSERKEVAILMTGFFVTGFLIVTIFATVSSGKHKELELSKKIIALAIVLLCPFVIAGASKPFLEIVFRFLLIRQENVMLILSESNYQHLKSASIAAHVKVDEIKTCSNETVINNATLVWHGVGSKSLVSIHDANKKISIELESNGIYQINLINKLPEAKNSLAEQTPNIACDG